MSGFETDPEPLTDRERALVKRLLSDPFSYPPEFLEWIRAALERDPPLFSAAAFAGYTTPREGSVINATVAAGAGIEYGKLDLAGEILEGDLGFAVATQAELDAHLVDFSAHPGFRRPLHKTGLYYCPDAHPVAGTPTLNQLNCTPFWVKGGNWDRIAAFISGVGAAGSVLRMGIYADDGDGFPGALILDAGTKDTTVGGVREINIAQATDDDLIWVASVAQVAAPQAACAQVTAVRISPVGMAAPSTVAPTGYFKAGVAGALPNPFGGAITDVISGANSPIIWLRRA